MVKTEVEIAVSTTGTEDAKDEIKSVGKAAEQSTEGVDAAVGLLDEATGGLASRVKNVGSSIVAMGKGARTAFKTAIVGANGMKKALISTGIGALIVAVGLLIAYWDDLVALVTGGTEKMTEAQKEYNEALNGAQASAAKTEISLNMYLKSVQDVTAAEEDRLFALEQLKKAGIETGDIDINNADALQILNDRVKDNIQLSYARAKANAASAYLEKELTKQFEAQNKSLNDQLAWYDQIARATIPFGEALTDQIALQRQQGELAETQEAVNRAQDTYKEALEELVALEGENLKTQTSVREELERRAKNDSAVAQALKDREAAEKRAAGIYAQVVKDLEALRAEEGEREIVRIKQNYEERIALLTAQYGAESEELKNLMILRDAEIQAIEDAQQLAKEEKDKQNREARAALLAEIATAEANTQAEIHAKQLADTAKYYDKLIQQAKDAGIDIVELEKTKAEKLKEIQDKSDQQAIADKKATNEALTTTVTDSLTALADLTGENTKYTKAVSAAAAVINTYTGASKALAQGGIAGPIAAAGVIATGLATVRSIYATDVPSPPSGGGGGSSTPMPSALRPLLNFGGQGLNSGIGLDQAPNLANQITQSLQGSPIKAYVVSQEVQTQAKMNRKIRETATIG